MSADGRRPLDRVFIGRDDVEVRFDGRRVELLVGGEQMVYTMWCDYMSIESALRALEEQLIVTGFDTAKRSDR